MNLKKQYNTILKDHFGYDSLKPEQFDIIDQIVNKKRDILAVLKTGFGKSLVYQMPYLITHKCVIIISPLISLMQDQKSLMEKLNISVCCLNSTCTDKSSVKSDILRGNYKLIYITPEYLVNCKEFLVSLDKQKGLCLVAIDESHCCSTWSDFRPSYKELGVIRNWIPDVPILSVTATASDKVRLDIIKILKLEDPYIVIGNFDRPNLFITVAEKPSVSELITLLKRWKDQYMIIYCKTRKETDKIAKLLKCGGYHAGMSDYNRTENQRKFITGEIKCIVATISFGLGINVSNIRVIIHYGCPKNLESYYQEIGRAGRDGKRSECYLFYSSRDFGMNRSFIKDMKDPEQKKYQEQQIRNIEKYTYTTICRRKLLLRNFGGDIESCTMCDNCTSSREKTPTSQVDCTVQANTLLNIVKDLRGCYGSTMYIDALRGSVAKKITEFIKGSSSYGKGCSYSAEWWKKFIRTMISLGYLQEKSFGRFGASIITLSKSGQNWLSDPKNIFIEDKTPREKTITEQYDEMIKEIEKEEKEKWTDEEEKKMLYELSINMSIESIAKKHKRRIEEIKSRIEHIEKEMKEYGLPLEEIKKRLKTQ